jgi:uncharacterized protein (TIGR02453 family)
MLQQDTLQFLKQLKLNNSKEWMDANRKSYETAKADFEQFVTAIIEGISAFDAELGNLTAKQCIFRVNRDIRFSENKAPYKSNFGAFFSKGGKKSAAAGYYIHLEPGASFMGGGSWMPPADMLKNIRQEIDYDLKAFKKIIDQKDFKNLYPTIDGERLKKAPQGYDIENPAIEFLRLKSFTVGHPVVDETFIGKTAAKDIVRSMKIMKPFNDFLNRSLE